MSEYVHRVNYYETDKMGITHHSNYIRFMEEARMSFLSELGFPMTWLEAQGVASPVVSVNCQYRRPTTYGDEIDIEVRLTQYTGVKLSLRYEMRNVRTGEVVATASSSHCFVEENGRPVAVRRRFAALDAALKAARTGEDA